GMFRTTRIFAAILLAATVPLCGCLKWSVPGTWKTLNLDSNDAFYSVNFVNADIGWLNGQSDRTFVPPGEGDEENANKPLKPKPAGKKQEDPLKANQGFEILTTTDGGATWKQIPDQFKYRIRSVWFVDPKTGWALTIDRDILHTDDGGATWTPQ